MNQNGLSQASLTKAINMQFHEIGGFAHYHSSDEAYAVKLWQQELAGTKRSSSSTNPNPPKRRRSSVQSRECSTCFETKPDRDVTNLECCDTNYCRTCFQTWFQTSLDSKNIPKCCGQEISILDHTKLLKVALRKKHAEVKDEVEADRKIYCSNSQCGRFIKIEDENIAFAQCRRCRRKTCVACGDALTAHGKKRKTCPNYLNDETLREILSSHEWNRCPACFAPVEKTEGCNNIRCTCGTMFCFRCGDRKKGESDGCTCTRMPPRQHHSPQPTTNSRVQFEEDASPVSTESSPSMVDEQIGEEEENHQQLDEELVETPEFETSQFDTVKPTDTMRFRVNNQYSESGFTNLQDRLFLTDSTDRFPTEITNSIAFQNAELPNFSDTDDIFGEDMDIFIAWLAAAHHKEENVW